MTTTLKMVSPILTVETLPAPAEVAECYIQTRTHLDYALEIGGYEAMTLNDEPVPTEVFQAIKESVLNKVTPILERGWAQERKANRAAVVAQVVQDEAATIIRKGLVDLYLEFDADKAKNPDMCRRIQDEVRRQLS